MKELLKASIKSNAAMAKALSDDIFAHPEIAEQEYRTSQKFVDVLKEHGFEVEYPFMEKELGYGTAFRAVLDCGEGPSAAILVEYDALPGLGHACGHNLHGSMSILAGISLEDIKDKFSGKLYVIGTPAEEDIGAKVIMSSAGVFDDMALAVMIHCSSGVGSQAAMDLFSLRCIDVEFFGRSAHAAESPWNGQNALTAARKFMDLLDARRQCFTPDVRLSSIIVNGGVASNIIPEYAKLRTEFRTCSMGRLEQLDDAVKKCAQAAALALDCDYRITSDIPDFYDMVRVKELEDAICELYDEAGEPIVEVSMPSGSSDMGNVSYRCPAVQPMLSIVDEKYPLHTPEFAQATLGEKAAAALEKGAYIMAALVLRAFTDKDFCNNIAKGFEKSLAAKKA